MVDENIKTSGMISLCLRTAVSIKLAEKFIPWLTSQFDFAFPSFAA